MSVKLQLVAEAIERENNNAAESSLTDIMSGIDGIDVEPVRANAPEISLQINTPDAFEDVLRRFDASGNLKVTGKHAGALHKFRIQDILDSSTAKMVYEGLNEEDEAA